MTFGVSGKLWKDALVMYDHQTGSLWSHVTGEAIRGPMKETSLETYPTTQTTWKAWKQMQPDTKALEKPELNQSHYTSYDASTEKLGIFGRQLSRSQLEGKTKVIGFVLDKEAFVAPLQELSSDSTMRIDVKETPVLIYTDNSGKGVYVWEVKINDEISGFAIRKASSYRITTDTGATLNLMSGASDNPNLTLERIHSTQAYWFGWHNFYPNTEVIHLTPGN